MTLVAAAAVTTGGTFALLRTSWGADQARRLALPRINAIIAGQLNVEGFRFGGDSLFVSGVVLRAPGGEVVVRVEGIRVDFTPLALVRRRLVLRNVTLDRLELLLRQDIDGQGSNLSRALASRRTVPVQTREPAATKVAEEGGGLIVDLRNLSIRNAAVVIRDYRPQTARALREIDVREIAANGRGSLDTAEGALRIALDVRAHTTKPRRQPLTLVVRANGRLGLGRAPAPTNLDANWEAHWGDDLAQGRGRIAVSGIHRLTPDASTTAVLPASPPSGQSTRVQASLELERVLVTPALIHLFAPTADVWRAAVDFNGKASWDSDTGQIAAEIDAHAGGASLAVSGFFDVPKGQARGISLRGRHLNLSRLVSEGPPSDLGFDIEGHGEGHNLATLRGALTLTVPVSRFGGRTLGPIRLRADADRGRYKVMDLLAVLPGARLSGAGEASAHHVAFRGAIEVRDLGAMVSSVTAGQKGRPPRAAGRGRIEVRVVGPARAPGLKVSGRMNGLAWENNHLNRLTFNAEVPDLRHPQTARADLDIPVLAVGGLTLRAVSLSARSLAGRGLDAHLTLQTPEPVKMDVNIAWGRRAPSTGGKSETRAGSSFAGTGTGQRVNGRLAIEALGARVGATFDVPTTWPVPAMAPVALEVTATNVDLSKVMAAMTRAGFVASSATGAAGSAAVAGKPAPPSTIGSLRGQGTLTLKVTGTGAVPRIEARADIAGLGVGETAIGKVALTIDGTQPTETAVRVELQPSQILSHPSEPRALPATASASTTSASAPTTTAAAVLTSAGKGVVQLRVPLGLPALLGRARDPRTVARIPLQVDGSFEQIAVGPLAAMAGYLPRVAGTVSLRVKVDGTLAAPKGEVTVQIADVATGRFPPTDALVRLSSDQNDTRGHIEVTRRNSRLLVIDAKLDAPATAFGAPGRLATAPLEVHALFGPYEVQRLGLPPEDDRSAPRVLRARLRSEFEILGSLSAPRLRARIDAADLRLDKLLVGTAQADINYEGKKAEADLRLISANKGSLRLAASVGVDLGYPQVLRRVDPKRVPIAAKLTAVGFDLSGFSGATRKLRTVGGQLFAAAQVNGTAADPRMSGRVEWKDGVVVFTGMGEYRRVHALVHGDANRLILEELRAESAGGRAVVSATGDHRAGQGYEVKARADLDSFPVYVEGQALARISANAKASAQVSVHKVVARVGIDEAHVELTDAKRKQLQKLGSPQDVVLVSEGEPLNSAQARKLAVLTALSQAAARGEAAQKVGATTPSGKAPPTVVVTVDAVRNLWVKGKDANFEIGLERGFRVELTDVPHVYGNVRVLRGRLDVAGRRFDLKAGSSVRFSGSTEFPELDVRAQHDNQKENIKVLVTVKGTPDHLKIAITAPSRPDLSETQLYTLVVTGRLDLGGGSAGSSTTTDKAASLLGGLMASQLQKTLAKKLPFDVLTIEAGNGLSQARLEAGTYVTSDLYVGYVGNLGANAALLQNRNALHLEYELNSGWSFEGEYGDAKTGTADFIWTKRY